ncbi:hypothetical protein AXX12_02685 [Anaerosporomusa subterranea]|uniref:Uncharacterized protein n=1 Tax=Anaerosporomusa subterranea TaxID=1794912 RepID=A0A154BSS2_ANASB|nr:hypothetical protein [Anaerosporomusa subterranea]KYZ77064.1 hypothetical protein AXX12_02685 [Anaerosporomusa subterranea]
MKALTIMQPWASLIAVGVKQIENRPTSREMQQIRERRLMVNFETIGQNIGNLVDQKQKAYGDAISAVEGCIRVLYPAGIQPEQYRDLLLQVRILDKQCRIARGDMKAFGENPWGDVAGYGILGVGHGGIDNDLHHG